MLFPIIKVYNQSTGTTHIIGTNTHDMLKINKEGLIDYFNLQNNEETGKYSDFKFLGIQDEMYGSTIEFVTFEELTEIYNKKLKRRKSCQELMMKLSDEALDNRSDKEK